MPDRAVLFHNGCCCRLELEIRGEGPDARAVIVIQPVPPIPASHNAFNNAVIRLGFTFGPGPSGKAQRAIAELIWNERGRVDAEALLDIVASRGITSNNIQDAVRRILLCNS